ncbi:branched-chain amino acid ABC transporter permease [Bradyrhizobium sp. 186]|uniref:branched-chain amino acid ABC transporter permease n=1 Tax=Bradyrhizobium sp. 186 TaxID=2782654 RepID=UPI0020012DB4|nr:branched-chain amino acid ABC transporter permease [Bradyrhizobium sp. 186]UPK38256.1 branched-chain amino acid ABC transporter permease [Bradyrhizobium sp. 186]
MTTALLIEQLMNGLQLGIMLFLMSAGLTLVFGIMNMINLMHGTFYMAGAFVAATIVKLSGSFVLGLIGGVAGAAALGALVELGLLRKFYSRSHLDQVLVTFGLVLVFGDLFRMIWGPMALPMQAPSLFSGFVKIFPGVDYPAYRLAIIAVGLLMASALYVLVVKTKAGMWVRAGASDRDTAQALGVNVQALFSAVFALGAALAGLAGLMTGPVTAVQVGMGEPVLILALVVTVIGGIGSVQGALFGAILIGIVDTFGRVLLPASISSMIIFILMAGILAFRPAGLVHAHG